MPLIQTLNSAADRSLPGTSKRTEQLCRRRSWVARSPNSGSAEPSITGMRCLFPAQAGAAGTGRPQPTRYARYRRHAQHVYATLQQHERGLRVVVELTEVSINWHDDET